MWRRLFYLVGIFYISGDSLCPSLPTVYLSVGSQLHSTQTQMYRQVGPPPSLHLFLAVAVKPD